MVMQHSRTPKARSVHRTRRGVALFDVIVGGMMLAIGMGVVLSVASQALTRQTDGERRLVASWLADELLNMVIVEGPDQFSRVQETSGVFDPPFADFRFDVDLEDVGLRDPFRVTATISWPADRPFNQIEVQTLIAPRKGEILQQQREPLEPIDREERFLEMEEQADGL